MDDIEVPGYHHYLGWCSVVECGDASLGWIEVGLGKEGNEVDVTWKERSGVAMESALLEALVRVRIKWYSSQGHRVGAGWRGGQRQGQGY